MPQCRFAPGGPILSMALLFAPACWGQEIRIGMSADPSAIDPHYHVYTPNEQIKKHVFEALVRFNDARQLVPGLAESWRSTGPTTWEFKLRKGVSFSDGSPFTAQDVIYTVCRIGKVANSPAPFTVFTKHIAGMEATDPHTLVIKTTAIHPLLPNDLTKVGIVSARLGRGETVRYRHDGCEGDAWPGTEDFNKGRMAVGTGPYKIAEFVKGSRVQLVRNEAYWGPKPEFAKVLFRPITADGPRVAALLSGDVDMIENPPPQDLPRIRKDERFAISAAKSARVIYVGMDSSSDSNVSVPGRRNPFKDKRVREAVSRAIGRQVLADKVLGGYGSPAWQLMDAGDTQRLAQWHDPRRAKELLAEAGYPNGFEVTLAGTNDRYINDDQVVQAIAQMLTSVGIRTSVALMPSTTFFPRQRNREFGFFLGGWLASTGELSQPVRALVATHNKEKGHGVTNHGRYSNPALDKLLDQALETLDDGKRAQLLQRASDLAIEDFGILPIHYEVNHWAMKRNIAYKGRWDQETFVPEIGIVK